LLRRLALAGTGSGSGVSASASAAFLAIDALRSAFVYAFQWTLHIRPRPSFWLGWTGKSAAGASCASIPNFAEPMHRRMALVSGVAARFSASSIATAAAPSFAVTDRRVAIVGLLA
jgi:hypothetical protein